MQDLGDTNGLIWRNGLGTWAVVFFQLPWYVRWPLFGPSAFPSSGGNLNITHCLDLFLAFSLTSSSAPDPNLIPSASAPVSTAHSPRTSNPISSYALTPSSTLVSNHTGVALPPAPLSLSHQRSIAQSSSFLAGALPSHCGFRTHPWHMTRFPSSPPATFRALRPSEIIRPTFPSKVTATRHIPRRPSPRSAGSRPECHATSGSNHEGRAWGGRSRTTAAMELEGDVLKIWWSDTEEEEEGAGCVADEV